MLQSTLLLALVPGLAAAAVHDVSVGQSGLVFTPDTLTAAAGDTVNFHFYPGDHSVAQSTFSAPCKPSGSDAIYSGFVDTTSGVASKMFTISITDTSPIWLYCSQISHCQAGMAMVINAPAGSTIAQYQSAAKMATTESPSMVEGGVFSANVAPGSGGSSGSSSAAASMASSSASSAAASSAASSSVMMSSSAAAMTSKAAASSMASSAAMTTAAASMSGSGSATAAASTSTAAAAGINVHAPAAAVAAAGGLWAWALI